MEISDIGYSYRAALLCHTNRPAIRSYTSYLVGKWLTPERDRVGYYGGPGFLSNMDIIPVRLWRSTYGTADEGIFWCEIKDATETLQTVYVGLYHSGKGKASFFVIHIHVHCIFIISPSTKLSQVMFHYYQLVFRPLTSLEVYSSQVTLTCISTGGPAISVTWTRDSITVTEGTETVLDDPVTAQYTHTLNVTAEGVYTCTVANSVSFYSADITLKGTSFQSFCQQIILAFLLHSSTTSN